LLGSLLAPAGARFSSFFLLFRVRRCTSSFSLSTALLQSSASLNDIAFFFFFFCVGDSWGGLIAIVLLAVGGFGGIVGWIVDGGIGD
jgi:hypothetical protein